MADHDEFMVNDSLLPVVLVHAGSYDLSEIDISFLLESHGVILTVVVAKKWRRVKPPTIQKGGSSSHHIPTV